MMIFMITDLINYILRVAKKKGEIYNRKFFAAHFN